MLITICFIIILIVGILLWCQSFVTYDNTEEISGFRLLLTGGVGTFICAILIIVNVFGSDMYVKT